MNHNGAVFMYLKEKFGLFKSEAKLKGAGNSKTTEKLNFTELDARKSFKQVVDNFFGQI